MSRFYEVSWGPRALRIMAWACWIVALINAAAVLLTLVTGPPDWNRMDKLGDAAVWTYIGNLHRTLADRTTANVEAAP